MEYVVVGLLGCAVGSFFSVLLERLGRQGGIIAGRSRCPACQHVLAWYDLIPLVSFLFIRGRCRYCSIPISWSYPFLEIASAGLAVLWYRQYGPLVTWQEGVLLLLVFGFFILALYDMRWFILPDQIIIVLGIVVMASAYAKQDIISVLLSAFLASLIFGILYVVSRGRWIGLGDVKLAALIGGAFPYSVTIGILFGAVWSAALVGIGMLLFGRATGKTPLPFGAFLSGMSIIAIVFAHELRLFTGFIPRIF